MGGLAVDVTDAYRNQTLLQSTADASSLAAVMSLPDQTDGLAQALVYASDNMAPAINGNVLNADVTRRDGAGRTEMYSVNGALPVRP